MPGPPPIPDYVFKIFRPNEWEALEATGHFDGSADDLRDGFIHLSTSEQVEGTMSKHFADEPIVIVARIRTTDLPIEMEVSQGGARFPHLYGKLRRSSIVSSEVRQRP